MADTTEVTWRDGMTFDGVLDNHAITVDAAESVGGRGLGPRPKGLLLTSLAGCTGMDVVSILRKMRVELAAFSLSVQGELTAEHPRVYDKIHLTYRFRGSALEQDKLKHAVELSLHKYCGVTAMLGKTAAISYDIEVSG